ncbi:hypothetical protein GOBAR_AA21106 [Gossypium barbadense]|uniref:Uncharacterized protein n=1 Tax=Gossypium barbadense TaxID=3634 RepID=A0A2P5X890_GOSBA|nr:hypothetical protein GOBAR_AA21106 [Gossypium barbadense]
MADWYGTMRKTTNGCNIRSTIDEDFDEEEMWCYEEEKEDSGPAPRKPSDYSSTAWRLPSAPRMVPRGTILRVLKSVILFGSIHTEWG